MNYPFILAILVIGLSGSVAQVLVLRELLISFYGNELTLGIILGSWILAEALGVFIFGKVIERLKNKTGAFIVLQIIFSLGLIAAVYLCRAFKVLLGMPFGEAVDLSAVFYLSFLLTLPAGFCHGALFNSICKIYSVGSKESVYPIGRVYALEIGGAILGGIILTYLFIPYLNSFQAAFLVTAVNLIICLFFPDITKRVRYIVLFLIFAVVFFSLGGGINFIHRLSINKQWRGQEVLDYRNSVYGNIVVTKQKGQNTFFYNGIPIITTPDPDIVFVQELGNLPLLFSKNPQDILVIGGAAGGLINEVLGQGVRKVDYAELDPLIIEMLRRYPSDLTEKELSDKRLNIINLDGRFFVKNTSSKYDIVLIGLSKPQDLSTNRLFTEEFFALVKKRLNQDGILAFSLPGSSAYLSAELRDFNGCIFNGVKNVFAYERVIPGDYNIFLASDSRDILKTDSNLITQRLIQRNIKTGVLTPYYLEYRMDKQRLNWFLDSLSGGTGKINKDLMPFAVFEALALWNKQFLNPLSGIFPFLQYLKPSFLIIPVFVIMLILFFIFYRRRKRTRAGIIYSIFTTGFFAMFTSLVLIFSFQVFYGYLYRHIGLLMSVFMAGAGFGGIFMASFLKKIRNSFSLFILLEMGIIVFSLVLPQLLGKFGDTAVSYIIFIFLFFVSGFLAGLEFPLAGKIYLGEKAGIGGAVGALYGADLAGGCLAGVSAGIILLPVLGLFNSCLITAMFKLSSFFLLIML